MSGQYQHQDAAASTFFSAHGEKAVNDLASRHGVSPEAVGALVSSMIAGGGSQAQFDHPDLGGLGQWSRGGMLMIGDMFNNALKAKIGALAEEASALVGREAALLTVAEISSCGAGKAGVRWPAELGIPSSTGSQNAMHYAVFPGTGRLAIMRSGQVTIYDTSDHIISGLAQQQSGSASLTLSSQHGIVPLDRLTVVSSRDTSPTGNGERTEHAAGAKKSASGISTSIPSTHDETDNHLAIFSKLEGVAQLHRKGILSDEEYSAKKAELLARL